MPIGYEFVRKIPAFLRKIASLTIVTLVFTGASASELKLYLFVSTECPVVERYTPRLQRLLANLEGQVERVLVFPNVDESDGHIKTMLTKRGLSAPWVRDPGSALVRKYKVIRIPTAVLVDPKGEPLYSGGIDDNPDPAVAKIPFVELAITAALAGNPPPYNNTPTFGCILSPEFSTETRDAVSFTKQLRPILQKSCMPCHREGGTAPFTLESPRQARRWALMMAQTVAQYRMPPWSPDGAVTSELSHKRLTENDRDTLFRWAFAQNIEPNAPTDGGLPPLNAVTMGTPTFTLNLPEDRVGAEDSDRFIRYRMPAPVVAPMFINGFEVLTSDRRALRDVTVWREEREGSLRYEQRVAFEPGFESAWLGGWVAGQTPTRLKHGAGMWVSPGDMISIAVHLRGTGEPRLSQTRVAFYQANPKDKFEIRPYTIRMAALRLEPSGMEPMRGLGTPITQPMQVQLVRPLMRRFAKTVLVELVRDQDRTILYQSRTWNSQFQPTFQFPAPLNLNQGDDLDLTVGFDNSASNWDNPNRFPKAVETGPNWDQPYAALVLGVRTPAQSPSVSGILPSSNFVTRAKFYEANLPTQ